MLQLFTEENFYKDKMIKEGKWNLDKDADKMWNDCIKRVAKDVGNWLKRLSGGKGGSYSNKIRERERERERAIEAHLDVETMLFIEIIKWWRGNNEGCQRD